MDALIAQQAAFFDFHRKRVKKEHGVTGRERAAAPGLEAVRRRIVCGRSVKQCFHAAACIRVGDRHCGARGHRHKPHEATVSLSWLSHDKVYWPWRRYLWLMDYARYAALSWIFLQPSCGFACFASVLRQQIFLRLRKIPIKAKPKSNCLVPLARWPQPQSQWIKSGRPNTPHGASRTDVRITTLGFQLRSPSGTSLS